MAEVGREIVGLQIGFSFRTYRAFVRPSRCLTSRYSYVLVLSSWFFRLGSFVWVFSRLDFRTSRFLRCDDLPYKLAYKSPLCGPCETNDPL
jgi:hypothetical protein